MRGLDPRIHAFLYDTRRKEWTRGSSPRVTQNVTQVLLVTMYACDYWIARF